MKVKEVMTGTPYFCRKEMNLGEATELMWKGNCGFLPVLGRDNRVCGVITDRDICMALGTRNKVAGAITVREVVANKLFACLPEDDIHVALLIMRDGHVRRLPVIAANGKLEGVISMDDILLRAEPSSLGKVPELSADEVVRTYKKINQRDLLQPLKVRSAAA
jgi:CBS domain-containing protein